MLIPFGLNRRQQHIPWMNITIIILNMLIFGWQMTLPEDSMIMRRLLLDPMDLHWYQFLSTQFLHADLWHIGGNMLFLFVFGNALEDRLRPIGYLAFYLGGGILAGFGHCLVSNSPALGASGAVSAVTGGFLILFPLTHVRLFYFIGLIGVFSLPSMILIGVSIAMDLISQVSEFLDLGITANVAFGAHLAGYAFGITVMLILIGIRLLERDQYDLLSLAAHWKRRQDFKRVTRQNNPWLSQQGDERGESKGGVSGWGAPSEQPMVDPLIMEIRSNINRYLRADDSPGAVAAYVRLITMDAEQVLSARDQKDVSNRAMQLGDYPLAETGYEKFLRHYPTDIDAHEIRLLLSVILINQLGKPESARQHLQTVLSKDTREERLEMAGTLMSRITGGA